MPHSIEPPKGFTRCDDKLSGSPSESGNLDVIFSKFCGGGAPHPNYKTPVLDAACMGHALNASALEVDWSGLGDGRRRGGR